MIIPRYAPNINPIGKDLGFGCMRLPPQHPEVRELLKTVSARFDK